MLVFIIENEHDAVGDLRKVQAWLNIFRFHVTRLLNGVEIGAENNFLRLDVDEHGGPDNVAKAVRQAWGLPMGPVLNVVNAVENAGAIFAHSSRHNAVGRN